MIVAVPMALLRDKHFALEAREVRKLLRLLFDPVPVRHPAVPQVSAPAAPEVTIADSAATDRGDALAHLVLQLFN